MSLQELGSYFVSYTRDLLNKACTGDKRIAVLKNIYLTHSGFYQEQIANGGIELACKKGCGFCCYIKVDAQAHEILNTANAIRQCTDTSQFQNILKATKDHYTKFLTMTLKQQFETNNACPLLADNCCLFYNARPFVCRNFQAQDIIPCIESFKIPDLDISSKRHEGLFILASIISHSVNTAYHEAGHDRRNYDFGAALFEALSSYEPLKRWREKKTAFSNNCVALDSRENGEPSIKENMQIYENE